MDAPSLIFRPFVHHFGGVTQTAYPGVSHTVFEV